MRVAQDAATRGAGIVRSLWLRLWPLDGLLPLKLDCIGPERRLLLIVGEFLLYWQFSFSAVSSGAILVSASADLERISL